ncbi:hypothetical protein HDU79_004172 [Rhizoclosmatium sp. JEL0117]|nr:hypothetical protein HDU79_004172 [Rhizoclosmatium sp. JEL0117]
MSGILTVVCGSIVIAFDLVLLTAFTIYVKKANTAGISIEADGKLSIVSRYGIATIVTSLFTLGFYVAYYITKLIILYIFSELVVMVTFSVLLMMKVSLFRHDHREEKNLRARITAASGKNSVVSRSGMEGSQSNSTDGGRSSVQGPLDSAPPIPGARRSTVIYLKSK